MVKLGATVLRLTSFWLVLVMALITGLSGQCENQRPSSGDFRRVNLATNQGTVMELEVAHDGRVFYAEKSGNLKVIAPNSNQVTTLHNFNVEESFYHGNGYGLTGVALDPNFHDNNRIYVFYFPNGHTLPNMVGRLSRFTLDGNSWDTGSERVIMEIPYNGFDHAAGSLKFDHKGNLFIGAGDDTDPVYQNAVAINWAGSAGFECQRNSDCSIDATRTAANTNDLRGKILRITPLDFPDEIDPTPGIGTTYHIPDGNLFPVGTDSTKPEIYAMGLRNPFKLLWDEKTEILYFGDPGGSLSTSMHNRYPQIPRGQDQYYMIKQPGNMGWPMFTADNKPYAPVNHSNGTLDGEFFDPQNPVNNSPRNTGKKVLPLPVIADVYFGGGSNESFFNNKGACFPMPGPIYRYKNYNGSTVKFPPYFDGKAFMSTDRTSYEAFGTVNSDGTFGEFENSPFSLSGGILDSELGPDGAYYFSSQNSVFKIEYTGSCLPVVPVAPAPRVKSNPNLKTIYLTSNNRSLNSNQRAFSLFDLKGKIVWQYNNTDVNAADIVAAPSHLNNGIYHIKYE